jgi:hypothetical protein
VATTASKPPVTEIGQQIQLAYNPLRMGVVPWNVLHNEAEYVPELQWPASVRVYDQMRADAQIGGLFAGTVLPIMRYKWMIDPNGARPEIVTNLSQDLNLNIKGQEPKPVGRQKGRFSFKQHMRIALLALLYGHYFFEQVGEIGADGKWHLRKLSERPPHTIQQIAVAEDGGLVYIRQNIASFNMRPQPLYGNFPEIPVDRLVAYVWDKEGANWPGRPLVRDCYKPWVLKDKIVRIDVINHERAGGVPVVEAPPDATPDEIGSMSRMASQFKVGENAGGALPNGARLNLARIGSGSDTIGSARYHDEEMARRFLMMFMQLGQTRTGSRALGDTFLEFFSMSQWTIADWFLDVFNEHVVEDYVDWNYGEDEEFTPRLVYEPSEIELSVTDLVALVDKGIVVVDAALEEAIRYKYNMPDKAPGAPDAVGPQNPLEPQSLDPGGTDLPQDLPGQGSPQPATAGAGRTRAGLPPLPLPQRPLRRQLYDHEIQAQVDFSALELAWQAETGHLVSQWRAIQDLQIQELTEDIIAANGNVKKLAKISATPQGADIINARMQNIAAQGISEAIQEAQRQGQQNLITPGVDEITAGLSARAVAVQDMLAASLSDAARRKALTISNLPPAEAAAMVSSHLHGLSATYLQDQLGGALVAAQNSGRRLAFARNEPSEVFASEILDNNTCGPCVQRDGTRYPDLQAAEADYPTGGYKDCQGGSRCRGTVVAVWQ